MLLKLRDDLANLTLERIDLGEHFCIALVQQKIVEGELSEQTDQRN